MTRDEFRELLYDLQLQEREVAEQGNDEYAHDDDNCFANFDRVGDQLSIDRKHVLLVYALKHWDGIISYIKGHRSQREDIRGRIKDLRCYLALLWGMIEEEDTKLDIEYALSTKCRVSDCNNPIVHGQTECIVHLKSGWMEQPEINDDEVRRNHLDGVYVGDIHQYETLVDRNSVIMSIYPNCAYCGAPYEAHEEVGKLGERGHRINAPTQPQHGQYHAFTPLSSRTKSVWQSCNDPSCKACYPGDVKTDVKL